MRYSARIESVANARRQQLRTARQLRTAQSPKERDARLQQLRTAREQTIATESTEERQTRLQQLRSAQQQRITAIRSMTEQEAVVKSVEERQSSSSPSSLSATLMCPSIGGMPINDFTTEGYFTCVFPTLFIPTKAHASSVSLTLCSSISSSHAQTHYSHALSIRPNRSSLGR